MAARQRDPDLVQRYRHDPRGTVEWWESERANVVLNIPPSERSTWLRFFLPYSSHCSNAIMTSRWHSSVTSPHGSATGHCHIPTSQANGRE